MIPLLYYVQVITNIDVQSIEPVDQHMRDSLMKSVQMAIEISTKLVQLSSIITDLTIVCVLLYTLNYDVVVHVSSLVAHNIFSCTTNHSLCQQVYLVMYTSSTQLH